VVACYNDGYELLQNVRLVRLKNKTNRMAQAEMDQIRELEMSLTRGQSVVSSQYEREFRRLGDSFAQGDGKTDRLHPPIKAAFGAPSADWRRYRERFAQEHSQPPTTDGDPNIDLCMFSGWTGRATIITGCFGRDSGPSRHVLDPAPPEAARFRPT
jgi:hypothetical protein